MLKDLVYSCRSYRRFYEDVRISEEELKDLVDLARMTASTANSQALKFKLVNTPEENDIVFAALGWAGALPDWPGPKEGERPSAYVIVLEDTSLGKKKYIDAGIAAQTIMLGSVEKGYGGCMLLNVQRDKLLKAFCIDPERYVIHMVLALGKPKEEFLGVTVSVPAVTITL